MATLRYPKAMSATSAAVKRSRDRGISARDIATDAVSIAQGVISGEISLAKGRVLGGLLLVAIQGLRLEDGARPLLRAPDRVERVAK